MSYNNNKNERAVTYVITLNIIFKPLIAFRIEIVGENNTTLFRRGERKWTNAGHHVRDNFSGF